MIKITLDSDDERRGESFSSPHCSDSRADFEDSQSEEEASDSQTSVTSSIDLDDTINNSDYLTEARIILLLL